VKRSPSAKTPHQTRKATKVETDSVTASVRQKDGSFLVKRQDGHVVVAYPTTEVFDILAATRKAAANEANEFNVRSQRSPKGSKYKLFSSYSIFYLVFMLIDAPLTETKNSAP
jgi:hypothetical protein